MNLISNLFNIPSLATDVENNLLHQVNFKYFSVHDFHSSREISQAFSQENSLALFHANLRSLSANYDDLISLLADLKQNFNIIGISETRILMGKNPVVNINILGIGRLLLNQHCIMQVVLDFTFIEVVTSTHGMTLVQLLRIMNHYGSKSTVNPTVI